MIAPKGFPPRDTLRAVAKAAQPELDYWRELFDPDGLAHFTIPLGVVAVVIHAAIEAGVVQMEADDDIARWQYQIYQLLLKYAEPLGITIDGAGSDGDELDVTLAEIGQVLAGMQDRLDDAQGDIDPASLQDKDMPDFDGGFYTQTPAGHTIHVNGDPDMPEETAQALREVADKVFEQMSKKAEPAPTLSPAAAATLGPEHVVVTPLVPRRTVAPLADDAPKFDYTPKARRNTEYVPGGVSLGNGEAAAAKKGRNGNVLPTVDELIAELKRQSMGTGDMPSRATFDAARPGNWATSQAHLLRLGVSWSDLAAKAGLKENPRGMRSKATLAGQALTGQA